MDPVTVIGLLASLCNIIEGANGLLKIAKTIKEGERDLFELCNDVGVFEEALKGFERVLRSSQACHNISTAVINKALEESFMTIQDLCDRLSAIAKSDVSTIRRMKWMQNKSALKRLHEKVKAQSSMLQSFLALAHTETFLSAYSHYHPLPMTPSSDESPCQTQIFSSSSSDCSETIPLTSRTSLASSACSSINSLFSSARSISSSLQFTVSDVSEESSESSESSSSIGPLTIRNACRFDCYCSCHPKTQLERGSGLSLNKPFSQLGLSFTRCDDPRCESAKSVEDTAGFTSSFFQKTLSHVMSSHSVKVRYNLNTFHIVPEGSEVMRYTKQGNLDNLRSAIQSGQATIWDTAPDGWSLLHTAAYNRQLPTVKYLLELGADTEVADIGARKPADLAILNSLMNGATPIEHEISKTFAEKDDYLNNFDFTPLHIAVLEMYEPNDHERPSVKQLLELLDDCNNAPAGTNWMKWKAKYKKRSPLFASVIEYFRASAYEMPRDSKIIHNLVDRKDRSLCWTPLHWACSTGKTDKIATLIYHGADPFILSNLNFNILHAAAESKILGGLADALKIWRPRADRLDINQRNHWGETPLHIAAWGSVQNVQLLVEAGADRAARQEDGQVPLHCTGMTAKGVVRRQIIDLLCTGDNKNHINEQDTNGRPPLFEFLDDANCAEKIIQYGASLDLLDTTGKSAFHHACMLGNDKSLKSLLRLSPPGSVMVTVKDHDGNTALNLALKNKSEACALILLEMEDVGDMVGQEGWASVHLAAKLGNPDVLEAVLRHRNYKRGMKTIDGKTAEVVAMEEGNWRGQIRELLRRDNAIT